MADITSSLLDDSPRRYVTKTVGFFSLAQLLHRGFSAGLGLLAFIAACSFCFAVLGRQLGQVSTPYTQVQHLGLNMFTVSGTAADGCFQYNLSVEAECFLGDPQTAADFDKRVNIMYAAIDQAHASHHWDRSNSTLKIFTAAEFFWRGPHGAYRFTPEFVETVRGAFAKLQARLSHERFKDWVFVLGTIVAARFDAASVSFYNFAPIIVGGEQKMYVEFKHHISTADFPDAAPEFSESQADPDDVPRPNTTNCYLDRTQKRCSYSTLPHDFLEEGFGFKHAEAVQRGVFTVKGLRIGIEICLDHHLGELAANLGSRQIVDVHLIVSAGMTIAAGPICTKRGGPTFLNDGFGRTAMSLNLYGRGREFAVLPNGGRRYNVGGVYGADSAVALGQWMGTAIEAFTGRSFGVRTAGFGTLPGGAPEDFSGIPFAQISAFGPNWLEHIQGLFDSSNYEEAAHFYSLVKADAESRQAGRKQQRLFGDLGDLRFFFPTIDLYGPLPLA
eukprot:TRINITY_DN75438_c0_g1_i1.p1 TRINITY_DN75438_c0_g1~~TRINITY_DN75438_c0_g1_i1.p1  ORF type:complete len:524 (+),score=66.56 TRINITY_DN75438_c0_g1_i1:72-1574(+)